MKVGFLGGGQLAQMMAQAGQKLHIDSLIFNPDPNSCAARYGELICAEFDDTDAQDRFIGEADVITYEFENIPADLVAKIEQTKPMYPSAQALRTAQDRWNEKTTFEKLGIPTTQFRAIDSLDDLKQAVTEIGLPAVLKTRREGYDGKGQFVLKSSEQIEQAWQAVGQKPSILESFIQFQREVSVIAARSPRGELKFYPLAENIHREGILRLSISRDRDPLQAEAEQLIGKLLNELDYVGVLALELFDANGKLVANEMAPRVHNSGHWTIEGAHTSQFENHLRAVCDMPLGDTGLKQKAVMVNLIGMLPDKDKVAAIADATYHDYGKAVRPGRKVGHVTLVQKDCTDDEFKARVASMLQLVEEHEILARLDEVL